MSKKQRRKLLKSARKKNELGKLLRYFLNYIYILAANETMENSQQNVDLNKLQFLSKKKQKIALNKCNFMAQPVMKCWFYFK